jgi:hypothetical protein
VSRWLGISYLFSRGDGDQENVTLEFIGEQLKLLPSGQAESQ